LAHWDSITGYSKDSVPPYRIGYYAGKTYGHYRIGARFPLASLPSGATVTQVRVWMNVASAGGSASLLDIHAYDTNGQTDPSPDEAQVFHDRCASGNLYYDDGTDLRTTGEKWITLGGSVCQDVMNAKSAVNRFSLGLHEEGDNDPYATLTSDGVKLEITYTAPPVVWGGSALPQLEMAKVILGL
jgi:hypothetical protein